MEEDTPLIRIYIETLGCAKNTVYSEYIAGLIQKNKNQVLTDDPAMAHIIIVNTCGFITAAKEESINTLLALADFKENGICQKLIAIGCLVQKYADELQEAMPEIDFFIGTTAYDQLNEVLASFSESEENNTSILVNHHWRLPEASGYYSRTISTPSHYAYLSVAEGCNNRCSYCAIPDMQGPYRSRPMEDILKEAKQLAENGFKELILIAQDTTYYGIDIYGVPSLSKLLHELCQIDNLHWIRILYAYPDHFTDELIETMASEDKICKYIDIPFQHINNAVLKRMNRNITKEEILSLIKKLRSAMPNIMIRSTFITGFPGETQDQFDELLEFLKFVKLDRVGVFPYSQEDRTLAGKMPDQVPEDIREERAEQLMEEQYQVMYDRHQSLLGKTMEVKVDELSEDVDSLLLCRSQGEAPEIDPFILVKSDHFSEGDFFDVKIVGVDEYDLIGVPLHEPA